MNYPYKFSTNSIEQNKQGNLSPTYQNLKLKQCKNCSNEFSPNSGRQDYCTSECKKEFLLPKAKVRVLTCVNCSVIFTATGSTSKFCSVGCREASAKLPRAMKYCLGCKTDITNTHLTKQYCTPTCKVKHQSILKYSGIEGIDFVTCPICELRTRQFTPDHAKMHGYQTIQEFAQANQIAQITCAEKKKLGMGENNPAFNHGGRLSPWSKSFIHGYDSTIHQKRIEEHKTLLKVHPGKFKTNIAYWLKETDNNQEEAERLLRKFQTRDLSWFVNKYGEDEGPIRYQAKTEKWLKTLSSKSESEILRINKLKAAGIGKKSKKEKELFFILMNFGLMIEHQFVIQRQNNQWYYYDIRLNNKIIEFNGDYWHCNPKMYEASYYNKRVKKSAKEIWEKDKEKLQFAKDQGFDVLVIWEYKYNTDKEQVIQECIDFLTK